MRTRNFGGAVTAKGTELVEIPVIATLERLLQYDAFLRKTIIGASDVFKSGALLNGSPPNVLTDMIDGTVARSHPHFLRQATADEVEDVRIDLLTFDS